jgi:hyperosmotically inducible protein
MAEMRRTPMSMTYERLLGPLRLHGAVLLAAAMMAGLAGCSDREAAQSRENVDAAVEKTQDATVAAARKAADLAEKARDNTVNYFKSPDVKEDVDAAVTASVSAAIARDPELGPRQIDVAANAGTVRLSGSAPSAEAKSRAEQIARTVNGVDKVDNRITVTATN